jgi:outer membrane cobalamin receptor
MKKWRWIGIAGAVLVIAWSANSFAEETKSKMIRLDEVVVSATRSEMSVFDAPQDVTVLSAQEIMASPFDRVEDLVRSVPGIYNFRHYGLQTNGIVSPLKMRGAGSNRVLVLVDGVPQNDNFNNAIAWVAWGHIPKETIERIEIVRGPTSAMYGSEGLGGVVHIITKKPKSQRQTSLNVAAGTGTRIAVLPITVRDSTTLDSFLQAAMRRVMAFT